MRTLAAILGTGVLLAGCALLGPRLHGPDGHPLSASAALWLPAGYERHLALTPEESPPGSFAEAMCRPQAKPLSVRSFADRFPGCSQEVLAYQRSWDAYFSNHVLPLLATAKARQDWPTFLAEELDRDVAELSYLDSVAHLHHALQTVEEPEARARLQALLAVHETQRLRSLAILQLAQAHTVREAKHAVQLARQLHQFRELLPGSLRSWTEAQIEQERTLGDLAGNDWGGLFDDAQPLEPLADAAIGIRADPDAVGLAEGWQRTPPDQPAGQQQMHWDQPTRLPAPATILWIHTELRLPPEPPATLFLNLRGFGGKTDVFVEGVLLGSHSQREDGRVSFRLPLDALHAGSAPRKLTFRIVRDSGAGDEARVWHTPWLSIRPSE